MDSSTAEHYEQWCWEIGVIFLSISNKIIDELGARLGIDFLDQRSQVIDRFACYSRRSVQSFPDRKRLNTDISTKHTLSPVENKHNLADLKDMFPARSNNISKIHKRRCGY